METENKIKNFRWRLKSIGSISHHDSQWKEIFIKNGFKWEDWWEGYCSGMCNLTGSFSDDKRYKKGIMSFPSIFGLKGENLFIKWLYTGKRKFLIPFYNWFVAYINKQKKISDKEERECREKSKKINNKKIENGWIYLLKSKNLYKIGRAKNIQSRIKTYKTENPFGIKIIIQKKVNDYIGIEIKLLKMFNEKQIRGEWFKLNKDDINRIKKYLNEI